MKTVFFTTCTAPCGAFFITPAIAIETPSMKPLSFAFDWSNGVGILLILMGVLVLLAFGFLYLEARELLHSYQEHQKKPADVRRYFAYLKSGQLKVLAQFTRSKQRVVLLILGFLFSQVAEAQTTMRLADRPLLKEPGIWIIIVLIAIPIILGIWMMAFQIYHVIKRQRQKLQKQEVDDLLHYFEHLSEEDLEVFMQRKEALDYTLSNRELSGTQAAMDKKGLLQAQEGDAIAVVAAKRRNDKSLDIDPKLTQLILWFLGTASFWLLFGTTVGEYLGLKFIAPDLDQTSWLSFGRLRPVHTNAVFWGWSSLGMIGLGYYIVPRVSNTALASYKWAWYSLVLINASVLVGSLSLLAGINNGGGEYREYIWPIMLLFALGLYFTLRNYLRTIAQRKTKEIYISNWYIVSAVIFITIVALVGYLPQWQDGLGETIVQGYYMHQAVGMWFMLFTLGIVYYFVPQQLNKPIYSYSLGILAFWTQILFYTLIGTHHFVFSAIPWWLQTVAIVASVGMVIPVVAGTTNFIMTFRGAWHKVRDSYTVPFFVVGIIFYFTGSLQGTAESFRFTNLLWHFTDFTVAHSHLTMYGIIAFLLWGGIYALVPQLTGKEAPQITVGAHFWLALIGLLFYSIPLMYGGTLRGILWMGDAAFIESVKLMMPYWLWRAIGGSLMWVSHLFFAFNFYRMTRSIPLKETAIATLALEKLQEQIKSSSNS
ncbi:cbb3-type cytochrome c oxidase subunit I [Myroides sp. NP-2]|uniref:cbb3-type cytochrome c oxidase subunit I n=1 Tax=Myroides sp. NP-2 TaxID=2759945 RepID=UPI0015FC1124|nr:cbb3-type cytochrome c oxidase subunit I [Myroides sp. NP-2]MBB1149665.1 cbb3-type cytochrome c oxidase subunit I [Myroides sp. NP-2]